jgi:replicative DNA helicase
MMVDRLQEQPSDAADRFFSFDPAARESGEQMACHISRTTADTHRLIRDNLHLTPIYGGFIDSKGAMLSDLRESGLIEQDAALMLMIYRDEDDNPETADRGITEVIVPKHRNGPVGTVKLLFEPQSTRFRNLAA